MKTLARIKFALLAFISKNQLRATILIFMLAVALVISVTIVFDPTAVFESAPTLGLYNSPEFWTNVIVESHGMLIDIFFVGILILWIDNIGKERLERKRYLEIIEDYRYWKSKEAALIISANVKRLVEKGVRKFNLHNCYLKEVKFKHINLTGSILTGVDFGSADLRLAVLKNTKMDGSYMSDGRFDGADMSDSEIIHCRWSRSSLKSTLIKRSNLARSVFDVADMQSINFINSDLTDCVFYNCNLKSADFRNADLRGVDFEGSILQSADLTTAKNISSKKLLEAATLFKAKLDAATSAEIRALKPDLLDIEIQTKEKFKTMQQEYRKKTSRK
jgi:uncharacterized protein YjbI with pentapeptide repeats